MTEKSPPSLADRMKALADSGHVRANELRSAANQLEEACGGTGGAKAIVGAWARARRVWSECTGEPLV